MSTEQKPDARVEALVERVMEDAQVFASAWALVGSRFDTGNKLEPAEDAKEELRDTVRKALRAVAAADAAGASTHPADLSKSGAGIDTAGAKTEATGQAKPVAWPSASEIADEIDSLLPMSLGDATMASIEEWWLQLVARKLSKLPLTHPAPAAPAVPDPLALPEQSACDIDYSCGHQMGYAEGWNACRAAMLAAEPADKEPQQ